MIKEQRLPLPKHQAWLLHVPALTPFYLYQVKPERSTNPWVVNHHAQSADSNQRRDSAETFSY